MKDVNVMNSPESPAKSPVVLELEPGTYYWCACGRSNNQPYCGGSHEGTAFNPMEFRVEHKKKVALCQCKRTSDAPFCDGTHKGI